MENTDGSVQGIPAVAQPIAPVVLPNGQERTPLGSGIITRLIGRGGMASVYEIWNPQLEIFRAVKLINAGFADLFHARFQTEIKISAKLKHPNIIEIYGVGEWNGLPYIEMEKIDGVGLDQIIFNRGALPDAVCTSVAIMICKALQYAHTQDYAIYGKNYHGVVHRDLKPLNIMVCANGAVKLMDFGIARPVDVSFQTMDGMVSGTLQYLSPEQLEKKSVDERSDLYSLGVTMYEIVAGVNPFPQSNFAHLVANKSKNKFQPIEGHGIKTNNRLEKLIYKCMQQDPRKRAASAAEAMRELEKIHATLTDKSPEEILAGIMEDSIDKKVLIALPRRFSWSARAAILTAALVITAAVEYYPLLNGFITSAHRTAKTNHGINRNINQKTGFSDIIQSSDSLKQIPIGDRTAQDKPPLAVISGPALSPEQDMSVDSTAQHPQNIVELMHEKYGTEDTIVIMEKEWRAKHYQNVLQLFEYLPANRSQSPQALILKMRALDKIGNRSALAFFLKSVSFNDAELTLAKARQAFANRAYEECRKLLFQSLSMPHALMDYESLKLEVFYYSALCSTALFDADPNERTYKAALDAWWQLRSTLRNSPDHPYNKKAVGEMQRMGMKMQNNPDSSE